MFNVNAIFVYYFECNNHAPLWKQIRAASMQDRGNIPTSRLYIYTDATEAEVSWMKEIIYKIETAFMLTRKPNKQSHSVSIMMTWPLMRDFSIKW